MQKVDALSDLYEAPKHGSAVSGFHEVVAEPRYGARSGAKDVWFQSLNSRE
jgi:hypothetical protein